VLVHDEQGHPLQVSTTRGDQHLTTGLAQILPPASESTGTPSQGRMVVDREGMAAPFLRDLQAPTGCATSCTLLRTGSRERLVRSSHRRQVGWVAAACEGGLAESTAAVIDVKRSILLCEGAGTHSTKGPVSHESI
jgi:hypothetical protein